MRSKRSQDKPPGIGPEDELDFVDDSLLQLAARLGDEANHLASVYPPKETLLEDCLSDRWPRPPRRRQQTWTTRGRRLWWAGTGTAAVLVLGLGAQFLRSTSNHLDDAAPSRWQPTRNSQQAPGLADNAQPTPDGAPVISPAMFVSELSDPEFEAWLDLRRNPDDERIAF